MIGVTICAVGRLRQSPEAVLVSDYITRFNKLGRQLGLGPASIVEVEDKTNSGISTEATLLEKSIPKNSVVCILDENGDSAPFRSLKRTPGAISGATFKT